MPLAVNRGKPVILADSGAEFSKAVRKLADSIAAKKNVKAAKKPGRQSLISKLRS